MIATNTMHKLVLQIEKQINIPILHISDATASRIKRNNLKKIGFLGTRFTMREDFIKQRLAKASLEVIIPEEIDLEIVDNVIFESYV